MKKEDIEITVKKVSDSALDLIEDANGRPKLTKDPGVIWTSVSAILEAVASLLTGTPGIGSAIGVLSSFAVRFFKK